MRILAGAGEPYAGKLTRSGDVGYLPQDPREGDLDVLGKDRVLSARGLDTLIRRLEKQQLLMAEIVDETERDKAVRKYGQLEDRFSALGGYVAESEAARICNNLGLPERVLAQALRTLSGGQRRRIELARILFARVRRQRWPFGHDAAARRADQPPRRRLDHAGCADSCRATTADSS